MAETEQATPSNGAGRPSPALPPTAVTVAALASAGAGLVHAAAAGTHAEDGVLKLLFTACAVAQLGLAGAALLATHRRVLLWAIAGANLAALGAWALTRTVGIGFIDSLAGVEAVGTQDLVAAVLAGVAVAGAVLALTPARRFEPAHPGSFTALAGVAILALSFPAVAAGHTHSHGEGEGEAHDHAGGEAGAHAHAGGEGDDHAHVDGEGDDHAHVDGEEPVISLDDPRLTSAQVEAATDLIDETTAAMEALPDEASLIAAGYVSIGDGLTGFEHYIQWSYLSDGQTLDADHIESVVLAVDRATGTKRVVSAMYILEEDQTMADVPDVAGPLTTWHNHTNLCWDETGQRLSGIYRNDRCVPRGELWVTPPMLHVWLEPQECGPFAGLEGHGSRGTQDPCSHGHATGAGAAGGHDHGEIPERLDHEPTDEQLDDARRLIDDTFEGTAGWADVAAAEADGFRSIGDGRSGVEHFVNADYQADGEVLDPARPESLVYRVEADGFRTLISAMYILPRGSTMDDVPDVAGNLTVWHGHDDLCFDASTGQISGAVFNGRCVPSGDVAGTPPMLHVWVVENDCGPFAGTDATQMTGSCTDHEF